MRYRKAVKTGKALNENTMKKIPPCHQKEEE